MRTIGTVILPEMIEQDQFFSVYSFDDKWDASGQNHDGERTAQSQHDSRLSEHLPEIERMPDTPIQAGLNQTVLCLDRQERAVLSTEFAQSEEAKHISRAKRLVHTQWEATTPRAR